MSLDSAASNSAEDEVRLHFGGDGAEKQDDDSFVLVDDEGNVIEAEEEQSCWMAVQYGTEVEEDTSGWYAEEFAKAQEHMRANPLLAEMLRQATADSDNDDVSPPIQGPANDDDDDDTQGMPVAEGFSREYTEEAEDDWILEKILKRRWVKLGENDAGSSLEYLCKWKWYADPTWEPRSLLEDEGLVREVDAFDATKAPTKKAGDETPNSLDARRQKRQNFSYHSLENFYPHTLGSVRSLFSKQSLNIVRYAAIDNNRLTERFIRAWAKRSHDHCPAILFHGTRRSNIPSICMNGLIIPGKGGIRVLNGSAYGVGIYTAKDPGFSRMYTDSDLMFVCLGLVGPHVKTITETRKICVFFEEELVVPMWLVQYVRTPPDGSSPPPQLVPLSELIGESLSVKEMNQAASISTIAASAHGAARKPLTKKMIKQAPRSVKDFYKQGLLRSKK